MVEKKLVLALSGGMDSTTLLIKSIQDGYRVCPVVFHYGSKHNKYETEAAKNVCDYVSTLFGNKWISRPAEVDLPFIGQLFKSNLLQSGGAIPEGHYQHSSMELTVVPARNIIFISIMVGYAWSVEASVVSIGVHTGDHAIYPDCRTEFINLMRESVLVGTNEKVTLTAPFQRWDKTEILKYGLSIDPEVPYYLTRTCYKDQEHACGKCGSCQERLEAFRNVGRKDPIQYAD